MTYDVTLFTYSLSQRSFGKILETNHILEKNRKLLWVQCGKKEVKRTLFVFSSYYVIFRQVFWVKRQDVILFAIWFACDISESTSSCLLIDCCIKHKCHLIIFFLFLLSLPCYETMALLHSVNVFAISKRKRKTSASILLLFHKYKNV